MTKSSRSGLAPIDGGEEIGFEIAGILASAGPLSIITMGTFPLSIIALGHIMRRHFDGTPHSATKDK